MSDDPGRALLRLAAEAADEERFRAFLTRNQSLLRHATQTAKSGHLTEDDIRTLMEVAFTAGLSASLAHASEAIATVLPAEEPPEASADALQGRDVQPLIGKYVRPR